MRKVFFWVVIVAMVFAVAVLGSRHTMAATSVGAFVAAGVADSSSGDAAAIRKVMDEQVAAWNRGDLDAFMTGYWNSADVEFVGANGVTRGYYEVLARYKKSYATKEQMGTLTFTGLEIHVECKDSAYAIGQFHLVLAPDNPSGYFTLNFRRFAEGWRIVVDHTTGTPKVPAR